MLEAIPFSVTCISLLYTPQNRFYYLFKIIHQALHSFNILLSSTSMCSAGIGSLMQYFNRFTQPIYFCKYKFYNGKIISSSTIMHFKIYELRELYFNTSIQIRKILIVRINGRIISKIII